MSSTTTDKIDFLTRFFLNRTDVVAARMPWGKPCPVSATDNLDPLIRAHVLGDQAQPAKYAWQDNGQTKTASGRYRVGAYALALDGTTRWVCIDIDGGPDHSRGVDNPEEVVRQILAAAIARGIPVYLERSGGGQGWHVWAFFESPEPAIATIRCARALIPEQYLHEVEIFPKQRSIGPGGVGSMLWLPWWYGAPEGANQFYRLNSNSEFELYMPSHFDFVPEDTLRDLPELPGRRQSAPSKPGDSKPPHWRPLIRAG